MLNKNDFEIYGLKVLNWINTYLKEIESYPVKSQVKPKDVYNQIPDKPPIVSEDFDKILADVSEIILPGITHWQHPNFHAYFPANTSMESIFAEFITAAIASQCMIWDTSPAAAELEERMMEWLCIALDLPTNFEGVIYDTASTATLTAILTAREVATNYKSNEEGVPPNLRVYCSTETHSSIEKAVGICGIGRNNLIKIKVDSNLALISSDLEEKIIEDIALGLKPICVVATIGTTGTVAIDPVMAIGHICQKYGMWLHVDAAYAGTALLLPEYRWMSEGMELADSFVFNPHKWMFTNFDCTAYFVKDKSALIKTFENLPEYLKTPSRGEVKDYRDWGIPLGRRFRALKLWFVMRSFGLEGLQNKLRDHIILNKYFAEKIGESDKIEILIKPFLNITCFRWISNKSIDIKELNSINKKLLDRINNSGELYLSHTKIRDQYAIRMVIGQTYVEKHHIDKALSIIHRCIEEME